VRRYLCMVRLHRWHYFIDGHVCRSCRDCGVVQYDVNRRGSHLAHCLRNAIRHPRVALLGVREFRGSVTTHVHDNLIESYDSGRELAHLVTMRRYEP